MSLIGRLWRRAPAWRLCLVAAIAFTGLAAMFPPMLPSLRWPRPGVVPRAHYRTEQAVVPDEPSLIHAVNDPTGSQGIGHFAGRQIPLPTGTWHELMLARAGGPLRRQLELLARIENSHLTGLIILFAPGPLSGAVGNVEPPEACTNPESIMHYASPVLPTQNPLTHECWALDLIDMHAVASDDDRNSLMQGGLSRLGDMNVAVAPQMLELRYAQTDDTGWLFTTIFVPGTADSASLVEDWANRFLPLMHKGFAGTLSQPDLLPAIVRDPV